MQMDLNMKVLMKMEKEMEKENKFMLMEIVFRVLGKIINVKV